MSVTPINYAGLNPLIIPVMDIGKERPGLGYDDLNDLRHPVVMIVQLNSQEYRPGDLLSLYWDNKSVAGQQFTLSYQDFEDGFLAFNVPIGLILDPARPVENKKVETYYTVYDQQSGSTTRSASRTILIKTPPPGGTDTDPSTPFLNDGLAKAVISPSGTINDPNKPVTVTVAPWKYMAEGDVLTVFWNGVELQQAPLLASEVGKPKVIAIALADLIEGGDGDPVNVNYDIRDIVDNYSLVSPPATVKVEIDPTAPPAPRIKVDGVPVTIIDLDTLGDKDVNAEIPNSTAHKGGYVTLTWLGRDAEGKEQRYESARTPITDDNFNLEINIPNAEVVAIAGGSAVVSYLLEPASGQQRHSRSTTVTIKGVPVRLEAPVIDEANGSVISPATNATVRIKPYASKALDDLITLKWQGTTQAGSALDYTEDYSVEAGEEQQDTLFLVDNRYLAPLVNGSLVVSYEVVSAESGNSAFSKTTPYVVSGEVLLPPPTVDNAPGDVFDPTAFPNGTTVRVDGAGGALKRNDNVTLHWTGPTTAGTASRSFNVVRDNQSLNWPVAASVITPSVGKEVDVRYDVRRASGGSDSSLVKIIRIVGRSASVITEDFTGQPAGMIVSGRSIATPYTTITFESGGGQLGFPPNDAATIPGPVAVPRLHVCFQQSGGSLAKQSVLIDLKRNCTRVECDITAAGDAGGTTLYLLDENKAAIKERKLDKASYQHYDSEPSSVLIRFIRIVGDRDWSHWDNIKMTF